VNEFFNQSVEFFRQHWKPIIGALISFIVVLGPRIAIESLKNSYGQNDLEKVESLNKAYRTAFKAELPEIDLHAASDDSKMTATGTFDESVYVSNVHFNKIITLAEKYAATGSEQDLAHLQVWTSALDHEKKHSSNQKGFEKYGLLKTQFRDFSYIFYQFNLNDDKRKEECSATEEQISSIRHHLKNNEGGKLGNYHLEELSIFIIYAEFSPEIDELIDGKAGVEIKKQYPNLEEVEIATLNVLEAIKKNDKVSNSTRQKFIQGMVATGLDENERNYILANIDGIIEMFKLRGLQTNPN